MTATELKQRVHLRSNMVRNVGHGIQEVGLNWRVFPENPYTSAALFAHVKAEVAIAGAYPNNAGYLAAVELTLNELLASLKKEAIASVTGGDGPAPSSKPPKDATPIDLAFLRAQDAARKWAEDHVPRMKIRDQARQAHPEEINVADMLEGRLLKERASELGDFRALNTNLNDSLEALQEAILAELPSPTLLNPNDVGKASGL